MERDLKDTGCEWPGFNRLRRIMWKDILKIEGVGDLDSVDLGGLCGNVS
jgi:hypothetical protein